jgi:hypothetical protein
MTNTQKRVIAVLSRMLVQVQHDSDAACVYADILEDQLSSLQADDFFGTEGQTDPRGDMRDGAWSMSRVQGIDK